MFKFKLSKNPKFNLTIGFVLIGGALLLEVIIPTVGILASRRAQKLAAKAQKESGVHPNQAIADYKVALILSPEDYFITKKLADLYIRQNRPDDAIAVLKKLPKDQGGLRTAEILMQTNRLDQALKTLKSLDNSDAEVLIATSRVLLEQGEGEKALEAAAAAYSFDSSNPEAQLQLGLCYAYADQLDSLSNLIASVSNSEALQGLEQAKLGKTPLAYELYSKGLLRAARSQLINRPNLNADELLLLGRINLTLSLNDRSKLAEAEAALVKAAQADPSNIETHRLLQSYYLKVGAKAEAEHQEQLIKQLESGQV